MVEYALLVALLAVIAIAAIGSLSDPINRIFCKAAGQAYDPASNQCATVPEE